MILLIIASVLFIASIVAFIMSARRNSTAMQILEDAEKQKINNYDKKIQREQLLGEIKDLLKEKDKVSEEIKLCYTREKERTEEQVKLLKDNMFNAVKNYSDNLDSAYTRAEIDFDTKIQNLKSQYRSAETELNNLKSSLVAATQARLREDEKKQKLDFYKLQVTTTELEDIKLLDDLKIRLHEPVILSKLIWSTYFQKQAKTMCSRVLGSEQTICGIYKITDLTTEQCYIGQSVDVAKRWTEHIKAGLGIDNNGTNKLYKAMQQNKIWNFTFELLEMCPREQLNEKEKFFIKLYQSDIYGMNVQKGNR